MSLAQVKRIIETHNVIDYIETDTGVAIKTNNGTIDVTANSINELVEIEETLNKVI